MPAEAWEAELLAISGESASQLIRQLLDGAPDAMVVIDARGRVLCFNLLAERLFGYVRDEVLGRDVELLIPIRFRSSHVQHRRSYNQAPSARPMDTGRELYGMRKDGTEFALEISLSPIQTARELLTCASIRDVSVRKHKEQQLQRTQERLLSAVESIQGAFAIFDQHDCLVLCNSSYRLLFGDVSRGPLEGQHGADLIALGARAGLFRPDAEQTLEAFVGRWLACRAAPECSLELSTADGRKLKVLERATTGGGRIMTIWDVTADAERAEQLQSARALAEAASSAKSEFLASMSHELRTPLNAILGFAQLLQRDKREPLSARQQERVGHVLRSGEHLLRLIDDVLDLARIEAGRVTISLEPVGLREVLGEVESTLEPLAARSGIKLQLAALPEPSPEVLADRTRLKQVLMNFCTNAIKYGRPQGHVWIRVSVQERNVRLEVEDDGVGIAEDQHSKLFQPFQRAGQETGAIEGTGIGLALSKRLAELMQGTVGFASQAGRGSVFWIELNLPNRGGSLPAPAPSTGERLDPLRSGDGPHFVVMYVEDNPSNIAFMEDFFLDYARVELITAPSAEIGLPLIRRLKPDVVFMDLNLPGMNGLDATQRLASWPETRSIPVVALSAAAMMRDAERIRGAGFYRYLTKPIQLDELERTLDELLLGSQRISATASGTPPEA